MGKNSNQDTVSDAGSSGGRRLLRRVSHGLRDPSTQGPSSGAGRQSGYLPLSLQPTGFTSEDSITSSGPGSRDEEEQRQRILDLQRRMAPIRPAPTESSRGDISQAGRTSHAPVGHSSNSTRPGTSTKGATASTGFVEKLTTKVNLDDAFPTVHSEPEIKHPKPRRGVPLLQMQAGGGVEFEDAIKKVK
ncbi:hypothetical protein IAR55_006746 [Kwoniella newhampshirensis]|uniref:Uncharacterized protein n=1 Tax=Kwoniella newhampshirensis TaxID=1651941 RepID=A0AAW0YDF6_9TREE